MGVHNTEAYPEIKRLLEIPEDEPIFILRAKDFFSSDALHFYFMTARIFRSGEEGIDAHFEPRPIPDENNLRDMWEEELNRMIEQFETWQDENPGVVKVPD